MIRLAIGLALMPSAGLMLYAASRAVLRAAVRAPEIEPFVVGLCLSAALWLCARYELGPRYAVRALDSLLRRSYVLGHELTHALAAWACGARVLDFSVRDGGGHVDLSRSNAFVALAPYCLPVYTLAVIAAYRGWLWLRPEAPPEALFLALMGASIAFHALKTAECLWDRRQPDLAAAGGAVFSLACIGLANGLVALVLLKALFPGTVALTAPVIEVGRRSRDFWVAAWRFARPLKASFVAQVRHP